MDRTETIYTDPVTGAQKGRKLARFDLIPAEPLIGLAEQFGRGAQKYDDRNWERGHPWGISYAALNRHLWLWWNGEDLDPETGAHHLDAVAFHVFALREFHVKHPEMDDRPNRMRDLESEPEAAT